MSHSRRRQVHHSSAIPKIAPPPHRHAAPSGPWPFLDLGDTIEPEQLDGSPPRTPALLPDQSSIRNGGPRSPSSSTFDPTHLSPELDFVGNGGVPEIFVQTKSASDWQGYPQSQFPNWTKSQQRKSGIAQQLDEKQNPSTVYCADVLNNGYFESRERSVVTEDTADKFWETLNTQRTSDTLLRAYFVHDLSAPTLQMLGSQFIVEPFFWSSFLKWIPSRHFQRKSDAPDGPQGEHITITLTFMKSVKKGAENDYNVPLKKVADPPQNASVEQAIDIQAPLLLDRQDRILVHDCMALHLIKFSPDVAPEGSTATPHESSTLISLHASGAYRATSAENLHSRFLAVGRSVYWSNMLSGEAFVPSEPAIPTEAPQDFQFPLFSPSVKRRGSGASDRGRRSSIDRRRRPSRGEILGLALDPSTSSHRRMDSIGSLALAGFAGGWLNDVDEEAMAEDEGEELEPNRSAQSAPRASPSEILDEEDPVAGRSTQPLTPTKPGSPSSPIPLVQSPLLNTDFPVPVPNSPRPTPPPKPADPSLIMLAMLWHAMYCWDETFEHLTSHIGMLETITLAATETFTANQSTPEILSEEQVLRSEELFVIQAHLLHYASLLADFRKSVGFLEGTALGTGGESISYVTRMKNRKPGDSMRYGVGGQRKKRQDTYSKFGGDGDDEEDSVFEGMARDDPTIQEQEAAMLDESISPEEQHRQRTMQMECARLVDEIERMERQRAGLENRLKNLMNLSYSWINIRDSKAMQQLTEAALRDNAAMKQISYLSTIFLPATLVAAVFGMNVKVLKPNCFGTLEHYIETVIPFSVVSIWLIVAMQISYTKRYVEHNDQSARDHETTYTQDIIHSLSWPWTFFMSYVSVLDTSNRVQRVLEGVSLTMRRRKLQQEVSELELPMAESRALV